MMCGIDWLSFILFITRDCKGEATRDSSKNCYELLKSHCTRLFWGLLGKAKWLEEVQYAPRRCATHLFFYRTSSSLCSGFFFSAGDMQEMLDSVLAVKLVFMQDLCRGCWT
jgi:hypothetical protein